MLSCLSRQTTDRDVRQVGEIQLNLAQVTSTTISHQSSQHCLVQGEGLFTVSREAGLLGGLLPSQVLEGYVDSPGLHGGPVRGVHCLTAGVRLTGQLPDCWPVSCTDSTQRQGAHRTPHTS